MGAISEAEWKIWYQDTFDRDCPRRVEIEGRGLVRGLLELWARHLYETVRPDGKKGFSRFNLWWKQTGRSVEVVGTWEGQARLRTWVFGDKLKSGKGYVQAGDTDLLLEIVRVHIQLILADQTSETILAAAEEAKGQDDFKRWLQAFDEHRDG